MHFAVKGDHVDSLLKLKELGVNINEANSVGETALHVALEERKGPCAIKLIEMGADVTAKTSAGVQPIHIAAEKRMKDVLLLLLTKLSIKDVDCVTEMMETPLMMASKSGNLEIVKLLVEKGNANIYLRGKANSLPIHYAAKSTSSRAVEIVQYLLAKSKYESLNSPSFNLKTPLYLAVSSGNFETARFLLQQKGINIEAASINKQATPLIAACKKGKKDIVELLLANNANFKHRTAEGDSALHIAVKGSHWSTVKLLVEKKAPINSFDKDNRTVLQLVCSNSSVSPEIIKLILKQRDANPLVKDDFDRTPLFDAFMKGSENIVDILLESAENYFQQQSLERGKAIVYLNTFNILLLIYILCIYIIHIAYSWIDDMKDVDGWTLFHIAAYYGRSSLLTTLLIKGADPEVTTIEGETPLHLACEANQVKCVRELLKNDGNSLF